MTIPPAETWPIARRFTSGRSYVAYAKAVDFVTSRGFSVGRTQAHAPTGILRGTFDIQKWGDMSCDDRAALAAVLTGDFRYGPVDLRVSPSPVTGGRGLLEEVP